MCTVQTAILNTLFLQMYTEYISACGAYIDIIRPQYCTALFARIIMYTLVYDGILIHMIDHLLSLTAAWILCCVSSCMHQCNQTI